MDASKSGAKLSSVSSVSRQSRLDLVDVVVVVVATDRSFGKLDVVAIVPVMSSAVPECQQSLDASMQD